MRQRRATTIETYGISDEAMRDLSRYNSEVARGLVHTDEYRQRMAELQRRYNDAITNPRGQTDPLNRGSR